jgi:hypothetical protein
MQTARGAGSVRTIAIPTDARALNLMLRFPDIGAVIAQYNQF